MDPSFGPNYDSAATILLGIFPEGDGIYNFARNGNALPQGQAIKRRYAINDYEFYGQDNWRVNSRLTLDVRPALGARSPALRKQWIPGRPLCGGHRSVGAPIKM